MAKTPEQTAMEMCREWNMEASAYSRKGNFESARRCEMKADVCASVAKRIKSEPAIPAPIAAQMENINLISLNGMVNLPATEQVDAARCPKCGSGNLTCHWCVVTISGEQHSAARVQCHSGTCKYKFDCHTLENFAQFFRAASLKQETQPPSELATSGGGVWLAEIEKQRITEPQPGNFVLWIDDFPLNSKQVEPAETPAAAPDCDCGLRDEYMPQQFHAVDCARFATPAPADTGAYTQTIAVNGSIMPQTTVEFLASTGDTTQPQDKPLTRAYQKVYDQFADLEFIAKEINGEDIALEDLAAQLEHATQCLREMFAATGKAQDALAWLRENGWKQTDGCWHQADDVHGVREIDLPAILAQFAATLPAREAKEK